MISQQFIEMLRCPADRSRLARADQGLLDRVNRAVAAGTLRNKAGQPVGKPIEAGLVREDKTVLYPIVEDIPSLLIDDGIALDQV